MNNGTTLPVSSAMDDFLFDLNGFLILKKALKIDLVARLNGEFDRLPREMPFGAWYKGAQRRDYNEFTGLEMHNVVEIGGPFEELIDHPAWLGHVRHYTGEEGSFTQGLFIDECLASVRCSGGHHRVHSGGYQAPVRTQYEHRHGKFRCGQVNIICALTDIGPGDGATMVVPGSHKSNLPHPQSGDYRAGFDRAMDEEFVGAIPVYLEAGDALLFVDGLMHGGSSRTTPGERRITIYRYGPNWGATRFGFRYSKALLERLTPARRQILEPIPTTEIGPDWAPNTV